ncbi:DUF6065 family protein [Pseudonocardia sp. Cha107L01]|uniref:DUF6065 family protein n=1 Tax=Pseudonocardia sp. Cha107L01 TaxID=3457576 RepID=UPI00403EDBF6
MNWKFTRATSTRFEQDEPIAMLVPHQRGDLESYTVYTVSLSADPGRNAAFRRWSADRLLPTSQLKTPDRDRGREHHTAESHCWPVRSECSRSASWRWSPASGSRQCRPRRRSIRSKR